MNIFQTIKYEHNIYKYCDINEADAVGWAFVSSSNYYKFPFKFPELKPNEIRANVLYTGLCHSDIAMCRSHWMTPTYPLVPGHEIIAEVSRVGSQVNDFVPGEKVAFGVVRKSCGECRYCLKSKETLCTPIDRAEKVTYGTFWGGWATQIQQPAEFFFKLPLNLDLKRAAPLVCAGCTVYGPIKAFAKQGDKCAVVGIGGLGHYAIKVLLHFGFQVTALTHTKDKKPEILDLGCKEILMLDKDQLKENKGRFDFIINTLPTVEFFNETLELCAPECKYVMVGIPKFNETLKVDFQNWIFKDILLIGSLNGSRQLTNELIETASKNTDLLPVIEEFSFEEFPKAIEKIESGTPRFRCVVNVEQYSRANNLFK